MKTKTKKRITKWFILANIALIVCTFTATQVLAFQNATDEIYLEELRTIRDGLKSSQNEAQREIQATEPSIREYIFKTVEERLGFDEAVKAVSIVTCESNFRPDICIIEPNYTISCGAWMINTVHNNTESPHYISNADKLDYKKATEWAINKRISDTNWSAWTCS